MTLGAKAQSCPRIATMYLRSWGGYAETGRSRMRARLDVAAGLLPGIHLLVLFQRLGASSHRLMRRELEELGG